MRNTENKIMGNCNSTCNSNMLNNTTCKLLKLVIAKQKTTFCKTQKGKMLYILEFLIV